MRGQASEEITDLLVAWGGGDRASFEELVPLIYDDLRQIAGRFLSSERQSHSLQSSEVVHEAFFRLVQHNRISWKNRAHFYGVAAQVMRRILIDHARRKLTEKRGGGTEKVPLELAGPIALDRPAELVALDDRLSALAAFDPLKAQIVSLRFFAGLSVDDTAAVVDCSRSTVLRQWKMAKAWLYSSMTKDI